VHFSCRMAGNQGRYANHLIPNAHSLVGLQVRYIINNLATANAKDSMVELKGLKKAYGQEISLYILTCLVEAIDFSEPKPLQKDIARLQLLSLEITELSQNSNFTSFILRTFPTDMEISFICNILQLPLIQEIAIGLAFSQSNNTNVQLRGTEFLQKKLNEITSENIDLKKVPEHLLHGLLFVMKTQADFEKQLANFLNIFHLQKDQLNDTTSLSLCSILVGSQGSNSQWTFKSETERGATINRHISEKLMRTVCPATLMEDIGYSCCSTANQLQKFLSKFLPLSEEDLAKMIVVVSRKDKKLGLSIAMQEYTSAELYGNSDRETKKPTSWNVEIFIQVIRNFKFKVDWTQVIRKLDFPQFRLPDVEALVTLEKIYSNLAQQHFPTEEILLEWNEKDGQLSLLRTLVLSPNTGISFTKLREVKILDNITSAKPYLNPIQPCWLCLDFLERLLSLAELHRYDVVRSLFETPMKQSPEILTIGLSQVQPSFCNALHRELISHMMALFFSNHANSSFVLHRVWSANRSLILRAMFDLYLIDKSSLSRILDIAQDLKVLTDVLHEASSYRFMIDLAALAAHREFLFLEKWLPGHIQKFGEPFVRACVTFLKENNYSETPPKGHIPLNKKTLGYFISSIQQVKVVSPDLQEEITKFWGSSLEQQVSSIFSQIYRRKNIHEAISIFNTLKNSRSQEDRDIFEFMVDTLFSESEYLGGYTEEQLSFTAELFGSLIQSQIFEGQRLTTALIIVLNTLARPARGIVFRLFGITALEQFKNMLPSLPDFCKELKRIPNLLQNSPAFARFLVPASAPAEQLLEHSIQQSPAPIPDKATQDAVSFIFNNVSLKNIPEKAKELKQKLPKEYFPWLAQYLVHKRVCLEENFHQVYLQFLHVLNFPGFDAYCLSASLNTCQILLQSDNLASLNERKMLKSIGSWLGSITLARNIPILQKQLDLKGLLLAAYQKGKLLSVVAFVARVLISCKSSRVFRPPNAYVMLLVRLLVEISNLPDIEMKITFEIEILIGKLSLDRSTIRPTIYLRNLEPRGPPNPDFKTTDRPPNNQNAGPAPGGTVHPAPSSPGIMPAPSSAPEIRVRVDPALTLFAENPQFIKAIHASIEKALQEIIEPILTRFVAITCSTTLHLVTKDFATEPNKQRVHEAAHLMVKNLVGNLINVTCKDLLRSGIEQNLTKYLCVPPVADIKLIQSSIEKVCTDNIEMACHFVEYRAMEQAAMTVEKQLNSMQNTTVSNPFARFLPSYLCADSNGLQAHQWRVYKDFGVASSTSVAPASVPMPNMAATNLPNYPNQPTHQTPSPRPRISALQEFHDNFKISLQKFEAAVAQNLSKELVHNFGAHILSLIINEETCLRVAETLFQALYNCSNDNLLDVYSFFLSKVAQKFPAIVAKITDVYKLLKQERKFDRSVTTRLIQFGLLSLPVFDSHIASLLNNGNQQVYEFALFIMHRCISELKCITQNQLSRSIEAIERIQSKAQNQQRTTLTSSTGPSVPKEPREVTDFIFETQNQQMEAISVFDEWCRLVNSSADSSDSHEMARRNYLKNPLLNNLLVETMPQFFALCTTVAVQKYLAGYGSASLDAFAQLISLLFEDSLANSGHNRLAASLINTALTAVAFTLESNFNASPTEFNQQPYFHLFSYWLNTLLPLSEKQSDVLHWQLLVLFSNVFGTLQPNKITGFCFSWVELISHRNFMPKLLTHSSQKGLVKFQELLVELFQFLEPFLRNSELSPVIQLLYNGTLRVLLVLVHDFPEFLCDYHFAFCDVIPPSCIQMRNLILAAFPRNMRLPDPATPELKIDRIEDIHKPPNILSSYTMALQRNKFIQEVDSFLQTRTPANFLQDLRARLLLPPQDVYANDTKYNVPLINSLVLYIGIFDLSRSSSSHIPFEIFCSLSRDLDAEGRYWMLNAIANQLRYPNNQTYYFSGILLRLFNAAEDEFIKEQITRVLLERLIVSRPHPWGLLITFIELLQNKRYNFWNYRFINCAPEITKLFYGVANAQQSSFPMEEVNKP